MGEELYCFDARIIEGKEIHGFTFKNKHTGWNEIFVEFTDTQKDVAGNLINIKNEIEYVIEDTIKSWVQEDN